MVDPRQDFRVVVNKWEGSSKQLKLGSPRGIVMLENKSPLHALLIVLAGIAYVFAVKFYRLIGSIRFGKLLL